MIALLDKALAFLATPVGVMVVALVWDGVRRLWPTKDAAGLFHDVAAAVKKVGDLLDKVAPQNLVK